MKNLLIICFTLFLALPTFSQENTQEEAQEATQENSNTKATTYYFIRHAEKDRSDKLNKDPHLIQAGILRAAKWSLVLEHVKFDAIYSTDYNRTKQTAGPTAERNGIDISIYDPRHLNSEDFAKVTTGKTVLIVGHSNTTPAFVNAVLGTIKYEDIDDSNNANLYIVSISSTGEKTDSLIVII